MTLERTRGCRQAIIPVRVLRVVIYRYQDGHLSAQTFCQVRLDEGLCGREVGRCVLHLVCLRTRSVWQWPAGAADTTRTA
jgi:hypothetical protein